ncbi:MAG: DUF1465 family protein [Pseudomonadota bacterium]
MGLLGVNERSENNASSFVRSELFARTFREGMALVEDTASYLDGDGRDESKDLPRDAALTYASISMRLTTRLMQIASWLLVLRAVREGEMSIDEASDEKYRITPKPSRSADMISEAMPKRLAGLVAASDQLYRRINRLDAELFLSETDKDAGANDAAGQQRALFKAFGRGA